jgi:hypothetical protein
LFEEANKKQNDGFAFVTKITLIILKLSDIVLR